MIRAWKFQRRKWVASESAAVCSKQLLFLVKSVLTLLIKKLILPRIRASKLPRAVLASDVI